MERSRLYDTAGSYLVDHPNATKAVRRRVAGLTCVAALLVAPTLAAAPLAAASKDPGKNPGAIHDYRTTAGSAGTMRE